MPSERETIAANLDSQLANRNGPAHHTVALYLTPDQWRLVIAALRSKDREDGAREVNPPASHAQLRYLARVASGPAPLGAIGCSRPIADKLTALGLWLPEQVRSHHRDRTYYRITEAGLSAIKALPLSPVRTENGDA